MISEVMGTEGEIKTQGYCGVEDTVYVAVSKNLEEGKTLLLWAVKNFTGKSICLLHVHQPNQSTRLWNRNISFGKLKWQAVATYKEPEHRKMHEDLDQYFLVLEQLGVRSGGVWSVANNIKKGIVQIIAQHGVRLLVMGAVEKHYSKKSSMHKSTKSLYVLQNAPASCQVVFSCKDYLITPRSISLSSDIVSIDMIPCDTNHGSTLLHAQEEQSHNLKSQSLKCKESWVHGGDRLSTGERMVDDLTLCSMSKSQDLTSFPMGHKVQLARSTHDELEHIMLEAENSKQRAFEESVSRWRAEEDAVEAMQLAKASESLYLEERNRNKEMEELLASQRRDLEILKDQHEQFLKEDRMIQDQIPGLERQITENSNSKDELEEKIMQAVTLLISFKDKRDMLQVERNNLIETVTRLRKSAEEVTQLSFSRIFAFSFSDILEASKYFDPSLKIGEGRLGTVYKGKIYHVDVAIRMLPFCGTLSDLEFKQKAEVLSRVRHPNIVTMYGVCTESRSLIYEYLENGSLADYLTGPCKINPLPWQIRIRVVVEICSVLIFLHSNKTSSTVLGNLRPDKILLDANFVSKLSDMGIHVLAPQDDNTKTSHVDTKESEDSSYLDPETAENGESNTSESDIYSFGIFVLHLLTTRPASTVAKDVRRAMDDGNLNAVLDCSAGDWPLTQTKELALLALRCCEEKRKDRPDLEAEVWPIIESMRDIYSCSSLHSTSSLNSQGQQRVPSHFVCPILQEVMTDPYIAADGFTYEADAIKGWLESGHKTSPMTNLELEHCDLLPNYALYYAIQEWQEQS